VIYRDSLVGHRQIVAEVLKFALRRSRGQAHAQALAMAYGGNSGLYSGAIATATATARRPRVVIVTRNDTKPLDKPTRKMTAGSEQLLLDLFTAQGADAEICCDFSVVNTVQKLMDHFLDVDVCVGLHGAGMANCALGRSGMVVTELMQEHGYGTELFMKVTYFEPVRAAIRQIWLCSRALKVAFLAILPPF
jgi:hypothetical protein